MPSLKDFKSMVEDCINETIERKFISIHHQPDFYVDDIKNLYNSTLSLSQKFSLFYNREIVGKTDKQPIDAMSFIAQCRADSYKNVMNPDHLQYTAMSRLYELLPPDLSPETIEIIQNVKLHAEYQSHEDKRLLKAVDILTHIKSNNLRAEIDLQLAFSSHMSLCASYADDSHVKSIEQGEANDLKTAAYMIEKYMPHLKELQTKPLDMQQFIRDQKAAQNDENKLHIPSMKQVCSFIPIMRTVDNYARDHKVLSAREVAPIKKALLATNGRDVKSVISGLVSAKINMFRTIDQSARTPEEIVEAKNKASYLFRWVLRDVEGAFKLGYALVVPEGKTKQAEMSMSVA